MSVSFLKGILGEGGGPGRTPEGIRPRQGLQGIAMHCGSGLLIVTNVDTGIKTGTLVGV